METNKSPYDSFVNLDYNSLSEWIFAMPGTEFTLTATIIGVVIGSQLNVFQQNALGNFFEQIGQTLITTSVQETNRQEYFKSKQPYNFTNHLYNLEREIQEIKQKINKK